MDTLRWLRVVGDTIFAAGMVALGWFVVGLKTGWSLTKEWDIALGHDMPVTAQEKAEVVH
jgi:nitric oxide reductase subunit B